MTTFKQNCIAAASRLGDYQALEVNELANGYCKALDENDQDLKESYISALILRYWYKLDKLSKENKSLNLTYDDYVSLLYERIDYACKYRAWQTGGCSNASQAIQQSIATGIKNLYYFANLDKSSANYNTISLDAGSDDETESASDWLEYQLVEDQQSSSGAEAVVQQYLDKNKIVQAILIDCICWGDSTRQSKETCTMTTEDGKTIKYSNYYDEFVKFGVVKVLNSLPENYKEYFLNKYNVNQNILEAGLEAVKKANNGKLYKYLAQTLTEIKTNKSILELLFN